MPGLSSVGCFFDLFWAPRRPVADGVGLSAREVLRTSGRIDPWRFFGAEIYFAEKF